MGIYTRLGLRNAVPERYSKHVALHTLQLRPCKCNGAAILLETEYNCPHTFDFGNKCVLHTVFLVEVNNVLHLRGTRNNFPLPVGLDLHKHPNGRSLAKGTLLLQIRTCKRDCS